MNDYIEIKNGSNGRPIPDAEWNSMMEEMSSTGNDTARNSVVAGGGSMSGVVRI